MESNFNFNSDELDLISIAGNISRFLKNYGKILWVCGAAGLAFGLFHFFTATRQYKSQLILHSELLTNEEAIGIINSWQNYRSGGEYQTLANIMHCSVHDAKSLSKISAEEIQKVYTPNNPNGFVVTIFVKDTSTISRLQQGIATGLENSPFVYEHIKSKKTRLENLIQKVNDEIAKLAVTKNAIDKMITNNSSRSTPLLIDISRINSEWIELNEKLLFYQEELKNTVGVQVLQDFTKPSNPTSPNLIKSIFFGTAAGLFVGYFISLFKYVQRRIKNLQTEAIVVRA